MCHNGASRTERSDLAGPEQGEGGEHKLCVPVVRAVPHWSPTQAAAGRPHKPAKAVQQEPRHAPQRAQKRSEVKSKQEFCRTLLKFDDLYL